MNDVLRILVVDDHPIVRQGLADVLSREPDLQLVAAVDGGAAALEAVAAERPDVVLLDLRLADGNGIEVLARLRAERPQVCVLILSAQDGDAVIAQALKAGAAGYLLKTMSNQQLLAAIRTAARGRYRPVGQVAERLAQFALASELTPREVDVLRLAARGLSNRRIGEALNVSEHTVKSYFRNVLGKLEVQDRTEAVAEAIRRGIIGIEHR